MSQCKCGCGNETVNGDFSPGHDQKLRIALEETVGGLLNLQILVASAEAYASGELTGQAYEQATRRVFAATV